MVRSAVNGVGGWRVGYGGLVASASDPMQNVRLRRVKARTVEHS